MKTWVKLYTRSYREPRTMRLSWQQRGIYAALLALAGEVDDRDESGHETGRLHSFGDTAWCIRCDPVVLEAAVDALGHLGYLEDRGGILYVIGFYENERGPNAGKGYVRSQSETAEWRRQIFERADYACQECGARGVKLEAHHLVPWCLSAEQRFNLDNGIALCRDCHREHHRKGWKARAQNGGGQ